jgi:hypothetical protein
MLLCAWVKTTRTHATKNAAILVLIGKPPCAKTSLGHLDGKPTGEDRAFYQYFL